MIALPEDAASPPPPGRLANASAAKDAMPAFAAIVAGLQPRQPLSGARIACTLPATAGANAVVEALETLGGTVRWAPFAGQRNRAAMLLDWPDGLGPNLLLEHGAGVSRLIHAGTRNQGRAGQAGVRSYSAVATRIVGVTEVAASGAIWFGRQSRESELLYPATDCSAVGPFTALKIENRSLRTSSALALLVLSQVEAFADVASAPALREPSAAIARMVSNAHDDLLRSRIDKLGDISSDAGTRDTFDGVR